MCDEKRKDEVVWVNEGILWRVRGRNIKVEMRNYFIDWVMLKKSYEDYIKGRF